MADWAQSTNLLTFNHEQCWIVDSAPTLNFFFLLLKLLTLWLHQLSHTTIWHIWYQCLYSACTKAAHKCFRNSTLKNNKAHKIHQHYSKTTADVKQSATDRSPTKAAAQCAQQKPETGGEGWEYNRNPFWNGQDFSPNLKDSTKKGHLHCSTDKGRNNRELNRLR